MLLPSLQLRAAGCIIVRVGLPEPTTERLNCTAEFHHLPVDWTHSQAATTERQRIRAGSEVRFAGRSSNVRDVIHVFPGAKEILARDTRLFSYVDMGRVGGRKWTRRAGSSPKRCQPGACRNLAHVL